MDVKIQDSVYKLPSAFQLNSLSFRSELLLLAQRWPFTNGGVYTPGTCMKGTPVHIKDIWIKQLCNHKVRDFAMGYGCQSVSGPSRNGPLAWDIVLCPWARHFTVTVPLSTQVSLCKWLRANIFCTSLPLWQCVLCFVFFCSDHEVHGRLTDVQASKRDGDCVQLVEGGFKRLIHPCNSSVLSSWLRAITRTN